MKTAPSDIIIPYTPLPSPLETRFFDKRKQKQQELQDEGGEGGLRHEMKSAGARGTISEIDEEKTTDNETLRLLFLVEGLPCVVAAVLTWFLMPDSPETARFLTREEQAVTKARSVRQVGSEAENRVGGGLQWREVGAAVLDWKPWITALMYFSCNVPFASLPVFLPTILAEMGFSKVNAQGLSAPPYFLAFLLVVLTTRVADKTSQRGSSPFRSSARRVTSCLQLRRASQRAMLACILPLQASFHRLGISSLGC
ncbi:hypothetical protein LZ554_003394 [Drepanopeziza brunnea f. sp. 'monogermtubi']|nr:hypothetical protein LZ554_003394 [Drepanopeziza brunnea f. sp. 'monogermtubi']